MKLISSIALFFTIISTYANTAEFPSGEKSYYNSTEPSLFKNDCTLTSTDKMSCVVNQLFLLVILQARAKSHGLPTKISLHMIKK